MFFINSTHRKLLISGKKWQNKNVHGVFHQGRDVHVGITFSEVA